MAAHKSRSPRPQSSPKTISSGKAKKPPVKKPPAPDNESAPDFPLAAEDIRTEPTPAARPRQTPGGRLELVATSFNKAQLIEAAVPQLALAGRSNVGKSSLVNALAGRKALAKISATPGKTRSINYYKVTGCEGFLVDLPGYGYAQCSHEERNKWAALMDYYFRSTPGLRGLVLLLDARLEPQKLDKDMAAFAVSLGLPLLPVLTKVDKCNAKTRNASFSAWTTLLGTEPLPTSAQSKLGIDELWTIIVERLNADTDRP